MTVAELIEELSKFPPHHAVIARYPGGYDYENGNHQMLSGSIEELRADQAGSNRQPLVVIDVLEWIE